jgi:hypothetical protein
MFWLCRFSKDVAKGLALYDGVAAARTTNENASRSTVRISIVAKQSDVYRTRRDTNTDLGSWDAFEPGNRGVKPSTGCPATP